MESTFITVFSGEFEPLMSEVVVKSKRYVDNGVIVKLTPLFAFAIPLLLLYLFNPYDPYLKLSVQDSFQLMWKGRTFQLFFIWLAALEFILSWENIKLKINEKSKVTIIAVSVASVLPSAYVFLENLGLNAAIANFSLHAGVTFYDSMPLAIEYLVFTVLFLLIIFLYFGKKGLVSFALPAFFVVLVGTLYTIDNVFPYGQFTPFQIFVPTTTGFAAIILNSMGYATSITYTSQSGQGTMPVLNAVSRSNPSMSAQFSIAWPCAGIESFLIFTAVALLFLLRMPISWKAKVGYFSAGVIVTYFINVMRIVTIFRIGAQYGVNSNQVQMFHFYYGPLYAIAWIVSFPVVILLSQAIWQKIHDGPKKRQP